ncbi:reverse transcriptase domain-containing protein [Tanacetum coccineum]
MAILPGNFDIFGIFVRIHIRRFCKPLEENAFRPVLHYYDGPTLRLELSIKNFKVARAAARNATRAASRKRGRGEAAVTTPEPPFLFLGVQRGMLTRRLHRIRNGCVWGLKRGEMGVFWGQKWGLKWVSLWVEVGVGLGAEMGVETCARRFWKGDNCKLQGRKENHRSFRRCFKHSRKPRGFAFIRFVAPVDAAEAKYHTDDQVLSSKNSESQMPMLSSYLSVGIERLGYVLPRDLSVGLIMNGLTSNFAGFAATPQVMAIQGGRIQKANKKPLNAKEKGKGKGKGEDKSYIPKPKNPKPSAKEHPTQDDTCHHCKEVRHC